MNSVVLSADSDAAPVASSTNQFIAALLFSLALHLGLAYTAQQLWPILFSPKPMLSPRIITIELAQPPPPQAEPEPIVEALEPPPPPPPKPVTKPKPVPQKPKPITKPVQSPPAPKPPQPVSKPKLDLTPIPTTPFPLPVTPQAAPVTPEPTYRPEPVYPMLARRMGHQGTVILEITLTQSGKVARAFIVESSGYRSLDQSALDAVNTWRFPANRFNTLGSFRQRIEFRLDR